MEEENVISLYQLATQLGNVIRLSPQLQNVWVTAELSDLQVRGGHCYTELVEKNEAGQNVARIRAMIWSSSYHGIASKFYGGTGSQLKGGIKVKVRGSISHHQLYGASFTINDIDPQYTVGGDLERLRREILANLQKSGIINDNKECKLPVAPQRIAVISAPGAAGYGDFMRILTENPEGFRFYPVLFPSTMQGDKAAPEVMKALKSISSHQERFDCVVIIRGGGATMDMNGFDNFQLARDICMFPLPVIVGIGHERDRCVLDEIACVRCATPTAVAGFLLDRVRDAWNRTTGLINAITREATLRVEGEKRHLAQLETAVPATVRQILDRENLRLDNFTKAIPLAAGNLTVRERTRLEACRANLPALVANVISRASERLKSYESLISVLSPVNTLKRGYSITRIAGKAVRSASQLSPGTKIETVLSEGIIHSTVDPQNNT